MNSLSLIDKYSQYIKIIGLDKNKKNINTIADNIIRNLFDENNKLFYLNKIKIFEDTEIYHYLIANIDKTINFLYNICEKKLDYMISNNIDVLSSTVCDNNNIKKIYFSFSEHKINVSIIFKKLSFLSMMIKEIEDLLFIQFKTNDCIDNYLCTVLIEVGNYFYQKNKKLLLSIFV